MVALDQSKQAAKRMDADEQTGSGKEVLMELGAFPEGADLLAERRFNFGAQDGQAFRSHDGDDLRLNIFVCTANSSNKPKS